MKIECLLKKAVARVRDALLGSDWGPEYLGCVPKGGEGEGVRILVLDTGTPTHKAIRHAVNRELSRSFVWDEPDIDDHNGHATMLCGIILDYAPKVELVCWKIAGKSGHVDGTTNMRRALEAAPGLSPLPGIVLISSAAYVGVGKLHAPVRALADAGVRVVCSAGNDPARVAYPAKFEECFPVFAFDRRGSVATFSPYEAERGACYPGVGIRAPCLGNGYRVASGASLAAAACAGRMAQGMGGGAGHVEA